MKNKRLNKIIVLTVLCIAIISVLVGCSGGKKLATPSPQLIITESGEGKVTWPPIPDAKDYEVKYGDTTVRTGGELSVTLPTRGKYDIAVKALSGDKKHKDSDVANISVTYALKIAKPIVKIASFSNGSLKYVIENYDNFASNYRLEIDNKTYDVKSDRGVLPASLQPNKYEVKVTGIGDNKASLDSDTTIINVDVIEVKTHGTSYETTNEKLPLRFTSEIKGKKIDSIYADMYEIDTDSYDFDEVSGLLTINADIMLSHVRDLTDKKDTQLLEVYFTDGNMFILEVKIIDNREPYFGDMQYVSVKVGHDATIGFDIYRNELVGIEKVLKDGTPVTLVEGRDYSISYNLLSAVVKIKTPNEATDKAIRFKFEKDNNSFSKEITYYFRDKAPYVTNSHMTFNKANSNKDIVIGYVGQDPTEVVLDMATNSDYILEKSRSEIIIKKEYLMAFDNGAIITGRIKFGSDIETFTINIINDKRVEVATFEAKQYNFANNSTDDLVMMMDKSISSSKISIDGKLLRNNFTLSGNRLTIDKNYLKGIGSGLHEVRVHSLGNTTYDVVAKVNVLPIDITPKAYTSIDNTYPNVAIHLNDLGEDVITEVVNDRTGKRYYKIDGENEVLVPYGDMQDKDTYTIINKLDDKVAKATFTYDKINVQGMEKYYNAKFMHSGEEYDAVITSKEEFETFMHYAFMHIAKMKSFKDVQSYENDSMLWTKLNNSFDYQVKVYLSFMSMESDRDIKTIISLIDDAGRTFKEPVKADTNVRRIDTANHRECAISIKLWSTSVAYSKDNPEHQVVRSRYNTDYENDNYSKVENRRSPSFDNFKINTWTKTQTVYATDELYFAIEDGVRPIPMVGSPAERMYDKIKSVLRGIVDDSMSEVEKYIAIFEWVSNNTTYDDNTAEYEQHLGSNYYKVYPRRCFYLEGVFDDGIAVCNGFAKAIVVMSGIEGIHAMKVVGYTTSNRRHAWIRANLDGVWYNSEPTWASVKVNDRNKGDLSAEINNHIHTLVADTFFNQSGIHRPDARFDDTYANIDFNYFANIRISRDANKVHSLVITNEADIDAIVDKVDVNKDIFTVAYMNNASDISINSLLMSKLSAKLSTTLTSLEEPLKMKYGKNYIAITYMK